jgi:hypothetical protein
MRRVTLPLSLLLACSDGGGETPTTTSATTTATTGDATLATTTTADATTADATPTTSATTSASSATDTPTGDTTATTEVDPTTTTGLTATTTDSTTGDPPPCQPGDETACYTGDPDTADQGLCKSGLSTCDERGSWGPCVGEVVPVREDCEAPGDEDCDGVDPCAGEGLYQWHKNWGGSSDEYGVRVGFDATGALILAAKGASTSDFGGGPLVSAGSWDLYLAKFAADGAHLWSKRFGDAEPQFNDSWSLVVEPGGEFVLAGNFRGTMDLGGGPLQAEDLGDIFLARFTGAGEHVWSTQFDCSNYALPHGLGLAGDGEIYLAGTYTGTLDLGGGDLVAPGPTKDAFIARLTATGEHVWSTRFGDDKNQYIEALVVDDAGNTTVGGYFEGTMNPGNGPLVSAGGEDAFIASFDPLGNAVAARRFGDADFQQLLAMTRAPDGRITVTGRFEGAMDLGGGPLLAPALRGFVAQFTPDGDLLWSKLLADGEVQPQAIAADGYGTLVLSGFFNGGADFGGGPLLSEGGHDIFAVKLAPSGAHVWSKRFGDAAAQDALGVAAAEDGTSAIVGGHYGGVNFGGGPHNTLGGHDGFLAVFGP